MIGLLWSLVVILFIFWVLGLLMHFGGALIHLVLVVALVLVVVNILSGRSART